MAFASLRWLHLLDVFGSGSAVRLLHLEGHVHYGQFRNHYLNLGFLYRDDLHGGRPLVGCIWVIDVYPGPRVEYRYVDLEGNLKEVRCPVHSEEGTFLVPRYWRRCPLCYPGGEWRRKFGRR